MVSDPLADWWHHTVSVKPFLRSGQGGAPIWGAPYNQVGFYVDQTKLVPGPDGQQVAASGQFGFPAGAPYIKVRSELTLPAVFGSRVVTVQSSSVGDGGGQPTPDHQEVAVL